MIKDTPAAWIIGGIILIAIGSFLGSGIILQAAALAGWVILITGIVKLFKHRKKS